MSISPGLYEHVVNEMIEDGLAKLDAQLVKVELDKLDESESSKILAAYLARILRRIFDFLEDDDPTHDRVALCNNILQHIGDSIENGLYQVRHPHEMSALTKKYMVSQEARILLAVVDRHPATLRAIPSTRPTSSLAENTLFTGAPHEPSMISELQKEILTADRIDFLISFIKWSGLRLIMPSLEAFTRRGGLLRVITTSYLGATDYKAIEVLSKLRNTEIRISYDTKRTRLHAKTYIFWRDSGFSTVYIGSSNLSKAAMTSGLEWNIKLSEYDSHDILDKIKATFASYWNNNEFVPFVAAVDAERLRRALRSERNQAEDEQLFSFNFDITPYYYQQEILDKLKAEREIHHSYKNLVVAATGTGKTVIAALDYRDYCRSRPGQANRLLFVAHRKEILQQSRDCFRAVLKDYNFASLLVGNSKAEELDHLFISIQSLNSKELMELTPHDFYDYIIIDEFHHAAAPSYQELLSYYQPKILLGLTATPERADGHSILPYFDGRIAAEMRLYEAIERKLLSPFHYFGVTDSVDLANVRWVGGKYDEAELEKLYVLDYVVAQRRVANIIKAIDKYCGERPELIAIGFCVTQAHARFMSQSFNAAGISSDYLTAESSPEKRDEIKRRLVKREINFVFVVDLYNEGVDIPEVNTVLFLRPTESLTVFLQQLGRGLRLTDGKDALTVLDFVGQAHRSFNFEERYKALLSRSRRTVEYEIKQGFVHLPRGCSIQLEAQAQEYILNNIRNSIHNKRNLINKLHDYVQIHQSYEVADFYSTYHVPPVDIYSKKYTLTALATEAGLITPGKGWDQDRDKRLAAALWKLSYANSRRWIIFLQTVLPQIRSTKGKPLPGLDEEERRMLIMFYYTIWQKGLSQRSEHFSSLEEAIYDMIRSEHLYQELLGLLHYQYEKIDFVDQPLEMGFTCPLDLHCSYTLDQILAALGRHTAEQRRHFQEGVLYLAEQNLDVFFVTLNKSEKDYSPSTLYHDYAINESQFHWQSQSTTTDQSPTGQRYINHPAGHKVLFFVREYKKINQGAMPYVCLGLADYISHYGSAPLSINWKMHHPMPGFVLREAVKA